MEFLAILGIAFLILIVVAGCNVSARMEHGSYYDEESERK